LRLERHSWPLQAIFRRIQEAGGVAEIEMYRTFNMGLGMLAVVAAADADRVKERLEGAGEKVFVVGEVVPGRREVEFVPQLR
jgi:phosphoribosylformylglycinamidine cyclo-ligase